MNNTTPLTEEILNIAAQKNALVEQIEQSMKMDKNVMAHLEIVKKAERTLCFMIAVWLLLTAFNIWLFYAR